MGTVTRHGAVLIILLLSSTICTACFSKCFGRGRHPQNEHSVAGEEVVHVEEDIPQNKHNVADEELVNAAEDGWNRLFNHGQRQYHPKFVDMPMPIIQRGDASQTIGTSDEEIHRGDPPRTIGTRDETDNLGRLTTLLQQLQRDEVGHEGGAMQQISGGSQPMAETSHDRVKPPTRSSRKILNVLSTVLEDIQEERNAMNPTNNERHEENEVRQIAERSQRSSETSYDSVATSTLISHDEEMISHDEEMYATLEKLQDTLKKMPECTRNPTHDLGHGVGEADQNSQVSPPSSHGDYVEASCNDLITELESMLESIKAYLPQWHTGNLTGDSSDEESEIHQNQRER